MNIGNNGHWIADQTDATIRDIPLVDTFAFELPGSGALTFVEYCIDPTVIVDPPFGDFLRRGRRNLAKAHYPRPWEEGFF